jgi:putative DNA primase/helicase
VDSMARALSALHALAPSCSRERWVLIGMAAKSAGLAKGDFANWSKGAPNYSGERDCADAWRSFSDGPVKAGTLYSMAFSEGWNDPAKNGRNGRNKPKAVTDTATPALIQPAAQKSNKAVSACWERCTPATGEHAYIVAKSGIADGLRIVGDGDTAMVSGQSVAGWLAVPAFSLNGELQTLQFIPPPGAGKKLNMPGASFGDGLFIVGQVSESRIAYVVEGIGQAWAVHRASGCAAVVAFGAGRMKAVAQVLRERHSSLPIVVVPDRGKESHAAAIAHDVGGAWTELPEGKPSNYDANDFATEYGDKALAELLARFKAPPMRYRLLSANEVANFPPLLWLVRGVLPAAGLTSVFGPSAGGKSFLVLDLCAAVAGASTAWFGCPVKSAPVVYVALEGEAGFSQRVKAWQIHRGRNLPAALHFIMQPLDLRNANDVEEIAKAVTTASVAGGLLVIDTLNRAANGADENSAVDMGEIIAAAKVLQSRLGGLVLLVHHSGKDVSRGLRGHSSLLAALDSAIEVSRTDDRRDWRIAKAKDGEDGKAHPFKLSVVAIGEHDDGELITSCVVVAEDTPAELRRQKVPQVGNQRIAWDALGELLKDAGDIRPKDAPDSLPVGRPAITVQLAVATIQNRLVDIEPQRQKERAKKALTDLHAKNAIKIDGGFVWVT